ncbi:hypothetical protein DSO57_1037138 [Entomophthora muscae]|uniref:Uncharacterized protein n=1 Tax=Entomophthora muscae TaxID=34485 RepID=A0ACC2SZE1_9FUNG|nr:hypothetical protein DSO57_1037138 [Entomophthora muscae]
MSNTLNYSGISNKKDACQMVAQMLEEDIHHFCRVSKEAKVALLYGLCQSDTGLLWSRLEIMVPSHSPATLFGEPVPGKNCYKTPAEDSAKDHHSVGGKKRPSKAQTCSPCNCPCSLEKAPEFLFVVMAQCLHLNLKHCIIQSSKRFHAVEDKDLVELLGDQFEELLVKTDNTEGVGQVCQSYILEFGLQVFSSWVGLLDSFPVLYLSLGAGNSDV